MFVFGIAIFIFDSTGWYKSLGDTASHVIHWAGVFLLGFSVLGQVVTLLESCILILLYSKQIWPGQHLFFWSAVAFPWVLVLGLIGFFCVV